MRNTSQCTLFQPSLRYLDLRAELAFRITTLGSEFRQVSLYLKLIYHNYSYSPSVYNMQVLCYATLLYEETRALPHLILVS